MFDPKRLIVALDYPAEAPALALVDRLDPARCRLKVGKEIFTRLGPAFVRTLHGRGFEVFLDLKFHDIPNTVAAACAAAADLGVWMVNVHCAGGAAMIVAARASLAQAAARNGLAPLLIGVTVLTSLDAADLDTIGCPGDPARAGPAARRTWPRRRARRRGVLAPGGGGGARGAGARLYAGHAGRAAHGGRRCRTPGRSTRGSEAGDDARSGPGAPVPIIW